VKDPELLAQEASLGGHRKLRPYRTVQPVASRYTDYAVPALSLLLEYCRVIGLEGQRESAQKFWSRK